MYLDHKRKYAQPYLHEPFVVERDSNGEDIVEKH